MDVGLTFDVPDVAMELPLRVALVAPLLDQLSVDVPPEGIADGLAEKLPVGSAITVTVAVLVVVPPAEFVSVSVYVVVDVGETFVEPPVAETVPTVGLIEALAAPLPVQVKVDATPGATVVGLAERLPVGNGTTVTVLV